VQCAVNELLLTEVRVKPMREQDRAALDSLERYFDAFACRTVAFDRSVFELATQLRVQHRVKTSDALHLAAAIRAGCDQFWTNDDRLAKAAEGHIEVITI
jgi:predicted nucleic acid-binding protein